MVKVFLSHSSEDKPIVRLFAHDLRSSGCSPWLDEIELRVGDSLIAKISDAIHETQFFIAFLSNSSCQSRWVQHELQIAATRGITEDRTIVLPVLLPGFDKANLPSFLSHRKYLELARAASYDLVVRDLLRLLTPENPTPDFLKVDAIRSEELLAASSHSHTVGEWIFEYLAQKVLDLLDPTERYWTYITIAKLQHPNSHRVLVTGLNDTESFARQGAMEGMAMSDRWRQNPYEAE